MCVNAWNMLITNCHILHYAPLPQLALKQAQKESNHHSILSKISIKNQQDLKQYCLNSKGKY